MQYHAVMNTRQRKTLAAIFRKPTPVGLEWRAVASLIAALGGQIRYGDGSKVRIDLKGESRYAVRLVRELLTRTGDLP